MQAARLICTTLFLALCASCTTTGTTTIQHNDGSPKLEYAYITQGDQKLRHGPFRQWHDNGQLEWRGEYANGARHGAWQRWHDNGQMHADGAYKDDHPDGEWTFWLPDGQRYAQYVYDAEQRKIVDKDYQVSAFELMEKIGPGNSFCPRDETRRVVEAQQPAIDACFEAARDAGEAPPDALKYVWRIDLSGEVFSAKPADKNRAGTELAQCHSRIIEGLRFEPPMGGECETKYKFHYRPQTPAGSPGR